MKSEQESTANAYFSTILLYCNALFFGVLEIPAGTRIVATKSSSPTRHTQQHPPYVSTHNPQRLYR